MVGAELEAKASMRWSVGVPKLDLTSRERFMPRPAGGGEARVVVMEFARDWRASVALEARVKEGGEPGRGER